MDKIPGSPFQPSLGAETHAKPAPKNMPSPSSESPANPLSLKKRNISELSKDEAGINPEIVQARLLSREGNKATYQKDISYEGDFQGDIPSGRGTFKYKDIKTYTGDVKDGFPHGYGKVTYFDGTSYEGKFENGLPSGSGVFHIDGKNIDCVFKEGVYKKGRIKVEFKRNGTIYYGPDENQKGDGVLLTANGEKYSGPIVNEKFHGNVVVLKRNSPFFEGRMEKSKPVEGTVYDDELVYTGQVNEDFEYEGKGVLLNTLDKSTLEGEFLENGDVKGVYTDSAGVKSEGLFVDSAVPTGVMRVTFPNGNVYVGTLLDGSPHGQGETVLPDGARYTGNFVAGDLVEGTIFFADGSVYTGEAKQSVMHGYGIYREGAFSYEGYFNEGNFEGWGKAIFAGVGEYEGLWKDGKIFINFEAEAPVERSFEWTVGGNLKTNQYVGNNQIIYPNGSIYTGSIIDGLANGFGVLVSPTGENYTGLFYDGKFSGQGKIQFKNYSYEGEFKDGLYEGKGTEKEIKRNEVRTFEGTYEKGLRQGRGVINLDNGLKLIAFYDKNIPNDHRTFALGDLIGDTEKLYAIENNQVLIVYSLDGVYVVADREGNTITRGTLYFPNGNRYVGQFGLANAAAPSFNPHGTGTFTWKGVGVYTGRMKHGMPDIDPVYLQPLSADQNNFFGPHKL